MNKVKKFQKDIQKLLVERTQQNTVTEWWSNMGQGVYTPRVDVASGPFAIEAGVYRNQQHCELLSQHEGLFRQLVAFHLENLLVLSPDTAADERDYHIGTKMGNLFSANPNARCFMAIEIENEVSRKHLMGGAINCSVLGKVGIAVGFNEEKHRCFLNLYRYFDFLRQVEKPTFNTANLLIIAKEQLLETLGG